MFAEDKETRPAYGWRMPKTGNRKMKDLYFSSHIPVLSSCKATAQTSTLVQA